MPQVGSGHFVALKARRSGEWLNRPMRVGGLGAPSVALIMPKTVQVAQTSELSPGSGKAVEADGRSIALFNVEGTFYAIDNTCTHRGGPLGEGELNGEIVTCPWHGANFNVKTGAVTRPPAGTGVLTLVVRVEAGDVLVELE